MMAESYSQETGSTVRQRGAVSNYLSGSGFAWLLEVDDDEHEKRPLLEELDIDVSDIFRKIKCVVCPLPMQGLRKEDVRDNPDFWGPLFVVVFYSLISISGQLKVVSWIMTVWICGSFIIYFLTRVLGGEVTYSQCIGVVGYCLLPLSLTNLLLPLTHSLSWINLFIRCLGVAWSTYSAAYLLCGQELHTKRPLVLYPVLLLYIYFLSLYTGV